jgi:hypothetical protein
MATDDAPKSALELAMERLRQKDATAGGPPSPITDEQKAAIAEARSLHASKIAELEILQSAKMRGVFDPAERSTGEAEYRREVQRLNDELDRKVGRIREKRD